MGRTKKEYFDQCQKELDNDPAFQEMMDKKDQDWWKQQDDEQQQQEQEQE